MLFLIALAVVSAEKKPLDCTPVVERLRGFTFCHFSNQSSVHHDTGVVQINPSIFQGKKLEGSQVTAIAISLSDFEHIPRKIFTQFGDVTRLKLMHSTIKEIRAEDFSTAPHLRVLEIEYTKVGKISSKAFEMAQNLEEVKFENCEIGDFADDAFDGLKNLREIRLSGNSYKNGQPDLSNLPKDVKVIY